MRITSIGLCGIALALVHCANDVVGARDDAGGDSSTVVDATPDAPPDTTPPPQTFTCASPHAVSTVAEISTAVSSLAWVTVSAATSMRPATSEPMTASSSVALGAADFSAPSSCTFCGAPLFVVDSNVAGVTCDTATSAGYIQGCSHVTIAPGTTFRVQLNLVDTHPSAYGYAPVLRIVDACTGACPDGTSRCGADGVCYAPDALCRLCEEHSPAYCACSEGNVTLADGTSCGWATSPDTECGGTCSAGVCRSTSTACR